VIHHVQLACPPGSEEALRDFYGRVLDFGEVAKPPVLAARGGCWFRGHGIELHLGVEQDFRPARKAHPGMLVRHLDAWADRLRAAGAPVRFDDDFPGCAGSTPRTRTATGWNSSNPSAKADIFPSRTAGKRQSGHGAGGHIYRRLRGSVWCRISPCAQGDAARPDLIVGVWRVTE
jgi:catechol 2,3-dioxygenase-like lactoylglutathione lyase family enzyme